MTEYWLISAPGEKTCQQTFDTVNNLTSKQNNLSVNYKFQIPDLKVGTLDQLVGLSDDLGKLDGFVEQITRKVASYLGEVLEDQKDKLQENLMANNNKEKRRASRFRGSGKKSRQNSMSSCYQVHCNNCLVGGWRNCRPPDPSPSGTDNQFAYDAIDDYYIDAAADEDDADAYSTCETGEESLDTDPDNANENEAFITPNRRQSSCSCTSNNNNNTIHKASMLYGGQADDEDGSGDISNANRKPMTKGFNGIGGGLRIGLGDLQTYITRFQWDIAKYPIKQSLKNIADIISKQVGQIDADLKTKSTSYNNLKGSLQNLEKKQSGSLMTRNLADLVKKEHFILDSDYLTTLLVIVPRALSSEWHANYEKLAEMIVPRSTQLIVQDSEYCLYTVSLFKKVVEEFKLHARERKFVVRDFTYNEEELAAGKNEITKLVTDKKKQFGPLVRWLKVNFSECFCAWIHVKALRVFVESVLRYGLPVNFQAILIHPNKKTMKRLRDLLNSHFNHLDSSALQGGGNVDSVDIPGLGFGQSEYYPYVYYKLNIDMIDSKI